MIRSTRNRLWTIFITLGLLSATAGFAAPEQPAPPSPEAAAFFESKVRPLLTENCFKCHGDKKQKGNLRLDSLAAVRAGGDRGPVVVPGQPEKSLLIKAIDYR